jgi:hypothetical protein
LEQEEREKARLLKKRLHSQIQDNSDNKRIKDSGDLTPNKKGLDATPNKSLNASFNCINIFAS